MGSVSNWLKQISTNQKHYPDLGTSETSSAWNFCARFPDVISRGSKRWCREMSAIFSARLGVFLQLKKKTHFPVLLCLYVI